MTSRAGMGNFVVIRWVYLMSQGETLDMLGPFWYLFRLLKAFDSGQPAFQEDLYKGFVCVDSGSVRSTDFRQLL